MKSWRRISALVFCLAAAGLAVGGGAPVKRRANELTLSGLRPGRDTRATALARYHKVKPDGEQKSASWRDVCVRRELRLEFDENGAVESVTVSLITGGPSYDCRQGARILPPEAWRTGRGLSLGDPRERVAALYGDPESRGPSTKQGQEQEFLFYSFDWAGTDVPQAMEITCDRKSGRVVEITLASASL